MKIGVASEGEIVAGHFGHCQNFNIYEIKDNKVVGVESVENPGHKPGFLPNYLNDLGIKVIMSGGMGRGAIDIFNEKSIAVVTGASGNALDCVEKYISGELKSTGSVCTNHEHSDECGGH